MDSNESAGGSKAGQAAPSRRLTRSNLKQDNTNDARVNEKERSGEVSPLRRSVAAAEASPAVDSGEPASKKQRPLKKNGNWSTADFQRAIDAIDGGAKIATAARAVNIPISTVRDHLYGKSIGRKRGRAGILSPDEENDLKTFLLKMANAGHPLTPKDLRLKVAQLTQTRQTPFKDGIPGKGWLKWWKKRHPGLASRVLRRSRSRRSGGEDGR